MPTAEELRGLRGSRVELTLTPAGGGESLTGVVVGTLDAADGLVVILERDDRPGRTSVNYQHISAARRL